MTTTHAEQLTTEATYDESGFLIDTDGRPWGFCSWCLMEVPADTVHCEDGTVVPELRTIAHTG